MADLKTRKGEYERFLSELDYLKKGYDLENLVETEEKDGVLYPMDPQPESLTKKYIEKVGDLDLYFKIEG